MRVRCTQRTNGFPLGPLGPRGYADAVSLVSLRIRPNGSLVNTTIVCVSPVPSGTGLVTTVRATATTCGAAVTPGPAGGAVVIQVPVCATSSPQITPSPTASGGINISGAYPYTIFASPAAAQSTPSPTASGGINISGAYPYTIFASPLPAFPLSVANGGTATSAPSPQVTATACAASPALTGTWPATTLSVPAGCSAAASNTYVATALADSPAHAYLMEDTPGPSTPSPGKCPASLNDSAASGSTAVPSAVPAAPSDPPLSTPLPGEGTSDSLRCGAAPIVQNGKPSIMWYNGGASGSFGAVILPASVMQNACTSSTSGTHTCNQAFTIEMVLAPAMNNTAGSQTPVFSIDTSATDMLFGWSLGGAYWQSRMSATSVQITNGSGVGGIGAPQMWDIEYDGSKFTNYYVNCSLLRTDTNTPEMITTSASALGWDDATNGRNWSGRMGPVFIYYYALTPTQICAHFAATGFNG